MKVHELIDLLKDCNLDAEVRLADDERDTVAVQRVLVRLKVNVDKDSASEPRTLVVIA